MNNFQVVLGSDSSLTTTQTCGKGPSVALDGQNMTVFCPTGLKAAQIVKIQFSGSKYGMSFCEVQVFASKSTSSVVY